MADTLLILGGADNVWEDYKEAKNLLDKADQNYDVAVINDMIHTFHGHVDYFFSLHGEKASNWMKERKQGNQDYYRVFHKDHSNSDEEIQDKWGGSSGLYAIQLGLLRFKYQKIIICGIPMDKRPNHFRDEEAWRQYHKYQKGWFKAKKTIMDHVKSMSGWSQAFLGEPTVEWLTDINIKNQKEIKDMVTLESIGANELDNLFLLSENYEAEEQVNLYSVKSGEQRTVMLPAEYAGKYIYVDENGVLQASFDADKKPTKAEIREALESSTTEEEVNEESSDDVEEETQTEDDTDEDNDQNETEEVEEPVVAKEPKKEADTTLFEAWMENQFMDMVQKGHAKQSIISTFLRDFEKGHMTYNDVVRHFGPKSFNSKSYKEIFKEVLKM